MLASPSGAHRSARTAQSRLRTRASGAAADDKNAFLQRVGEREYLVHDLDGVQVELHGDVAITYGRYVSLFVPRDRDTAAPPRLSSI